MKKMLSLVMTLVMIVSICCSCAASSNTDATPEKDSTTESTKETTTDTSTADTSEVVRQDSSTPAETETADTSEIDDTSTNELGLLNSDMEKIYALIAYDFSTNNIDSSYFTSKDDSWWLDISTNISGLYSLSQMFSSSKYDSTEMELYKLDGVEEDLILHDMFNVLTTSSQSSETIESSLNDHVHTVSIWKDLFIQNITFSDEQIQTGEALAKEFSETE